MDGACGVERRLDCTASSPLQERSGAAAVAAAEETRRGENSHPDARKRAQPLCLAAPTASALEDCVNKPHPFFIVLPVLNICKYLHKSEGHNLLSRSGRRANRSFFD